MEILSFILIVAGLTLFETVSSVDNAIINAEVLSTMKEKAKKWFLTWGLLFAVFVIRGVLAYCLGCFSLSGTAWFTNCNF